MENKTLLTYTAKLDKETLDKVKILAKRDDRTQQSFIAVLIKNYVKNNF